MDASCNLASAGVLIERVWVWSPPIVADNGTIGSGAHVPGTGDHRRFLQASRSAPNRQHAEVGYADAPFCLDRSRHCAYDVTAIARAVNLKLTNATVAPTIPLLTPRFTQPPFSRGNKKTAPKALNWSPTWFERKQFWAVAGAP